MSNLVEHARRELELLGEDPAYSASLVAAIAAFASFGHSGGSAEIAQEQMAKLLAFENLTPLTDDPTEWIDRSVESGYPLWQSTRNSKAFSEDGGKSYWLVSEAAGDGTPPLRYATSPARKEATA